MEEIFSLYDKTQDPDFIGQKEVSKEILEKSKNVPPMEYDQEKQTKYYSIMRWTVNTLGSTYFEEGDMKAYFQLIREIKKKKNTNFNTELESIKKIILIKNEYSKTNKFNKN